MSGIEVTLVELEQRLLDVDAAFDERFFGRSGRPIHRSGPLTARRIPPGESRRPVTKSQPRCGHCVPPGQAQVAERKSSARVPVELLSWSGVQLGGDGPSRRPGPTSASA